MNDLLADTLARIKNAILTKKRKVNVVNTRMNKAVLEVLKKQDMIHDYKVGGEEGVDEREIEVMIKYIDEDFTVPEVQNLERVSKPGQRIYVKSADIVPVLNGRGIGIISTSEGVMSHIEAKGKGLGGEYLCKIW